MGMSELGEAGRIGVCQLVSVWASQIWIGQVGTERRRSERGGASWNKMERSEAQQKFFSMPEVIERLISFLPPQSVLHMAESDVMDKAEGPQI